MRGPELGSSRKPFGTTAPYLLVSVIGSAAFGRARRNTTVRGSGASMPTTDERSPAPGEPLAGSRRKS